MRGSRGVGFGTRPDTLAMGRGIQGTGVSMPAFEDLKIFTGNSHPELAKDVCESKRD